MHAHSYCHLDTTPKYARKTVWKEVPVQGTRPVLVDKVKMMKQTVIDYKLQEVPSIKHGTRMVKRTRTRTVPGVKMVATMVPFETIVRRPVSRMVSEPFNTFVTQYDTLERNVTKVRMVPQTVDRNVLETTTTRTPVATPTWTSKKALVTVRVPKSLTPAGRKLLANPLSKVPAAGAVAAKGACSCFEAACACAGKKDCGCCWPTCGCAPSAKAPGAG